MSLDFCLIAPDGDEYYSRNITHNLGRMAEAAGVYKVLWRPEENGFKTGKDCIEVLSKGLIELLTHKDRYEAMDSPNGWGLYKDFIPFVQDVLVACAEFPDARVHACR